MPLTIEKEIANNYETFRVNLPQLLMTHKGKFVLMRHQEIVEFFDTGRDAYFAGRKLFVDDQLFSVQEIVEIPHLWKFS